MTVLHTRLHVDVANCCMLTKFFIAEKNHEKNRETILLFYLTRFFSREKLQF